MQVTFYKTYPVKQLVEFVVLTQVIAPVPQAKQDYDGEVPLVKNPP